MKEKTSRIETDCQEITVKKNVRYWPNGQLEWVYSTNDMGLFEGFQIRYYSNGRMAEAYNHVKKGHTSYLEWYDNGNRRSEEFYQDDVPVDIWSYWNYDGTLIEEHDNSEYETKVVVTSYNNCGDICLRLIYYTNYNLEVFEPDDSGNLVLTDTMVWPCSRYQLCK